MNKNYRHEAILKNDLSSPNVKDNQERSDLDIWRSFKGGHEGDFILIYNRFSNILFNQGIQITTDRELIKDCLQDFFVELRTRRQNLSDTDNIKLYLFKSFRRKVFAEIKKHRKHKVYQEMMKYASFPVELAIDEKIINAQYEKEQLQRLNAALKLLPAKEREALYYYYYQNFTYQEITEIYKYDHVSSARRLIYKAISKLKALLSLLLLFYFQ